jgi:hypothetical protein
MLDPIEEIAMAASYVLTRHCAADVIPDFEKPGRETARRNASSSA